jgi:hypothetical protein
LPLRQLGDASQLALEACNDAIGQRGVFLSHGAPFIRYPSKTKPLLTGTGSLNRRIECS